LFWCLFVVNAVLFAMGRGYLGDYASSQREPGRLQNQLNAGNLTLMSAADAKLASAAPAPAAVAEPAPAPEAAPAPVAPAPPPPPPPPPKPAPKAAPLLACTEVGNFSATEARRFDAALAPMNLGQRLSHRGVPSQDISSYIVYLPPQGSKENADKKTAELTALGVTSYFVISDASPLRWAVSLGVFKTEAAAQTLLATLNKQGVHTAKVSPRYAQSKQVAYQLRDLDGAGKNRLDKIVALFDDKSVRSCK
jgi:pyruvate/2-oxoglutarate dehydrogenase complex dihydrolipoamide acyltransferase (E2) component